MKTNSNFDLLSHTYPHVLYNLHYYYTSIYFFYNFYVVVYNINNNKGKVFIISKKKGEKKWKKVENESRRDRTIGPHWHSIVYILELRFVIKQTLGKRIYRIAS